MSDPFHREEELFSAALALPATERREYLERTCGGDADLLRRIEALLRAHDKTGGVLDFPAAPDPPGFPPADAPTIPPREVEGTRIGRYRLLEKIGEGGCGVVWMAEQEEPVHRRVALKIIKLGMDTKEVVARFEAERQALALMDHPNIAKVFDGGATDSGRPYFVMELVRGVKITDYCDQQNFSTPERLNLFVQVCHAIQHAHQKGIIHRDIKPSNILVTMQDGEPVPKVIDFGIAKATQGRLIDRTLFTAFEQFIGTPAYMSPEQAELNSIDVDARSDIYSLGVLLYELVTGRTPFEPGALLEAGLDEIRRQIREVEPPKPSARLRTLEPENLTTTAQRRATEPSRLIQLVRGDLDWIAMRCLEKDRGRRYGAATGLAADIERHLQHRPVTARPVGVAYRMRKLVRRNRQSLAIAGIAMLVTSAAGAGLYLHERRARERAFVEAQDRIARATAFREGRTVARAQEDGREKVGILGGPEKLEFSGNSSFPADSIRKALAVSMEYFPAAHPLAPLDGYLETVEREITRGYRNHGFPEVDVSVIADRADGVVRVHIDEGPRFTMGDLRIDGVQTVPATELVRALTLPPPAGDDPISVAVETILRIKRAPLQRAQTQQWLKAANERLPSVQLGEKIQDESQLAQQSRAQMDASSNVAPATEPVWRKGEPVSFEGNLLSRAEEAVRRALTDLGYPLAKVTAKLAPEPAVRRAHLAVHVDEGPHAVVGKIEVRGNSRNSPEQIAACAGLEPGMKLTSETLKRARVALWNSARFYDFDVRVEPRDPPVHECDIVIDIEESEAMPRLDESLSRQQTAMVRFANWVTTAAAERDFAITADSSDGADATLAITPGNDVAVSIRAGEPGQRLSFLMRPAGVRLIAESTDRVAGCELDGVQLVPRAWVYFTTQRTNVDRPHHTNVLFGASWAWNTGATGGAKPSTFEPELIVSPLFACQNFLSGPELHFENGEAFTGSTGGGAGWSLRFREDTGELLECRGTGLGADRTGGPRFDLSLRLGNGEFERLAHETDAGWARLPADPTKRASLADIVFNQSFRRACQSLCGGTEETRRNLSRTALAVRVLECAAQSPELSALLFRGERDGQTAFLIPLDPKRAAEPNALAGLFAPAMAQLGRMLGPPDAWPAKLGRELGYVLMGNTSNTRAVMDELDNDPHLGPIGSLMAAQLLRRVDPPEAWRFARRAMEHDSLESFHEDCQLLLIRGGVVGEFLGSLASAAGSMSNDDWKELTEELPAGDVDTIRRCLAAMRDGSDEKRLQALQSQLDEWWRTVMRPKLRERIGSALGGDNVRDPVIHAALVNGMPVSRTLAEAARRDRRMFSDLPDLAAASDVACSKPVDPALDELVTLTLAYQDATIRGLDTSDAVVDRQIENLARIQSGGAQAFKAMLARSGMTSGDYREAFRLHSAYAAARDLLLRTVAPPSEDEIAAALAKSPQAEFEQRHILIISIPKRSGDGGDMRKFVETMRTRALDPDGFANIWNQYKKKQVNAPLAVELTAVRRRDLAKSIGDAAFSLQPGGVSDVIETEKAWCLVHFVDPELPGEKAARRERAIAELSERKRSRAIADWLGGLRGKAFVEILPNPATSAPDSQ